jgi:cytochrome c oxidase subunit 2
MQIESPLYPTTAQAQSIFDLFWLVIILDLFILAVVAGLVVYIVIRYRARPGAGEPRQVAGNVVLEIIWTAIPVAIVTVIGIFTVRTMHMVDPSPRGRKPDLVVIAHQWWWELHYPRSGVVTANELHIPIGENWLLRVESADVVHDFWVPQLARKIDAVPGHPNHMWLQTDTPGTYLGSCNEFCGAGHAWMRLRVIAQTKKAFEAWEQQQLAVPPPPTSPEAIAGEHMFETRTCAACHTIVGTPARATVGPDLTHFADRETLAAGVLTNTPDNLAKWLSDPDQVKPGVHMPNLDLSKQQIDSLVAYLEGLR